VTFADEFDLRRFEWSDIVDHMPRLRAEVERYTAPQVVELGVRSGNSTCAFLAGVETVGGHVWSCDVSPPRVPPHWFASPLWTFTQGDDLLLVEQAPPCDVLFVDTTHAYAQTIGELVAYVPLVRPGGVILCHDTELERPELAPNDEPFPVRRAIEAFCDGFGIDGVEWVEGCNGLAVIRMGGD